MSDNPKSQPLQEESFLKEYLEKFPYKRTALLESEKMLHLLFHWAHDGILLMDGHGIIDCNRKALEMFGYEKKDILGLSPVNLSPEYQPDGLLSSKKAGRLLGLAAKGMSQFFEWCHRRKDGTLFDTEISLNGTEIAGDIYLQAVIRDITENKRAKDKIVRQRQRLQTLSDNAPFGMVLINGKGDFIYMNARFTELLGYDLSDVPDGRTWFRKAYPDPEIRHRAIERWKEDFKISNAGIRHPRVFPVTCKDGTVKTLNLATSGLASGEYLMTCEDMTEVKRLESRLNQVQKMESLGTLAGGMVHDFNNILTALLGFTSLIKLRIDKDTHLHSYVDQIFSTTRKAADLTKDLLTFSRQQPVRLVPTDINDAIKSTEKLLRKLLTEDIEFRTSFTKDEPVVMADKTQIDQILFNIATNAKDAMVKGGTFSIETDVIDMDSRFISAHGFGKPGRYVLLGFSDTGEGMDEATLQRIFDPFFTTKGIGKGTGLGLASVYGIVQQHNGFIMVYSEPGQGTTFRIYFPVTSTRVDEAQESTRPAAKTGEKVLIAEDDSSVLFTIQEVLREYGYTTIEAVDGQDAIEKFKANPNVDLVILDTIMPKKNGREVYDEIRVINPRLKVLFTSGYTKDVILNKGLEDDSFQFMAKPLVLDKFLNKVREMLDE